MRTVRWETEWVEDLPEVMERGKVYISIKHRLTEHLCACGCKAEVSLPLGRSDWRIEYDGETVSLRPSVGNWRLPCGSHYIIRESRTQWCRAWSPEEVIAGRIRDRQKKEWDIKRKLKERVWWKRILRRILAAVKDKWMRLTGKP